MGCSRDSPAGSTSSSPPVCTTRRTGEARADDLIERLALDEVVDLPAGAYSHGQSRRLSMAMALVGRPPLLLVDEPFDGVDLEGVDTITELLVEARDGGAAVVLTTHLLDAAVIADEVAVFRQHELAGPHPTAALLAEHGIAPAGLEAPGALVSDVALGMGHQFRNGWRMSRVFAIGAIVATVIMHGLAMLTAAVQPQLAGTGITVEQMLPLAAALWSALALLPALGGGESDDPMALAAAGAGRSFRFGARFASSLTDAGPGLFVPAIALVGAAVAGWPGWLAGLALAWNGLACGQLSGASSALLVGRIGPTAALIVVAGIVLLSATVLASSGIRARGLVARRHGAAGVRRCCSS